MSSIETLRTLINTWECDENVHMNIQFYFAHFDTAARHFAAMTGLEGALGSRLSRHVRYHAEMRVAECVAVRSAVAKDGPHALTIVHEMIDPTNGKLCATAIDGHGASRLPDGFPYSTMLAEHARPRSFDPAPLTSAPDSETLLARGGVVAFRGAVHPHHCDRDGAAFDQTYIAAFSDGVAHAWEAFGITLKWLHENGYGRVALELKLSLADGLRAGDLFHMISCCTAVERKTMMFRHHLFNTRTGKLAAIGEATGIVMDLAQRKSVTFPPDIRATLERAVVAAEPVT